MRQLIKNEMNQIAGGYIGESVIYDFALKPGLEVVGFERVTVDYKSVEYVEKGIFWDKIVVHTTPVYAYYPIYDQTFTTITY